ncbi:MFS transporter [soil metagenome]
MSAKAWTLVAAILGSSIVFLDSTVVNVALPRIGQELPSSAFGVLEGQSYVYNGYLLTLSALLILAGAVNDFYGRRRVFALGLAGFGVTSILCGISPNMELLVVSRVLQGAAGALLVPGSLALITSTFEGGEQGRAFCVWAVASAGTTLLGPVIGGLLVDTVSWRAAFLINVPVVALALWATLRHVRESRDENATGRFDWLGAFVVALAVGGLAFGAIYGEQRQWRDPVAFAALGVGALSAAALPFLMARRPDPLIPLALFRSRNFTVTNVSTLLIYGALYVFGYFMALFTQGTLGYTAAAAGLAGLPISAILAALSARVGALAGRYGPRLFMTVGPAVMSLGVLWLARAPAGSTAWRLVPNDPASWFPPASYFVDFFPAMIAFGAGLVVLVAPLTTALMRSVPVRNSGLASAINNAISRIGPQLAGAAIFVLITGAFYAGLAQRLPGVDTSDPAFRLAVAPLNPPNSSEPAVQRASREQSAEAFHLAMLASFGLLAAGAVVNAVGIQNDPTEPLPARSEARVAA